MKASVTMETHLQYFNTTVQPWSQSNDLTQWFVIVVKSNVGVTQTLREIPQRNNTAEVMQNHIFTLAWHTSLRVKNI